MRYFCLLFEILSSLMRRALPGPTIRTHEMDQNQCPAKPDRATGNVRTHEGEIDACG